MPPTSNRRCPCQSACSIPAHTADWRKPGQPTAKPRHTHNNQGTSPTQTPALTPLPAQSHHNSKLRSSTGRQLCTR